MATNGHCTERHVSVRRWACSCTFTRVAAGALARARRDTCLRQAWCGVPVAPCLQIRSRGNCEAHVPFQANGHACPTAKLAEGFATHAVQCCSCQHSVLGLYLATQLLQFLQVGECEWLHGGADSCEG